MGQVSVREKLFETNCQLDVVAFNSRPSFPRCPDGARLKGSWKRCASYTSCSKSLLDDEWCGAHFQAGMSRMLFAHSVKGGGSLATLRLKRGRQKRSQKKMV